VSLDVHEVLIVMELYEGTPVIDLLNQCLSAGRSLQEEKVLKIFLDVCQALARLHHRTKPILHRDLKVSGEREREERVGERDLGRGLEGKHEREGGWGRERLKLHIFL
jgi:serine/threonine protein kinase